MPTSRFSDPTFLALAAKKASRYVLYYNWFADPLEVVLFTQNLDAELQRLSGQIATMSFRVPHILPVPVPKRIKEKTRGKDSWFIHEVRTLAHLDFATQVYSTAILMAVADEWEEKFRDPTKTKDVQKVILGNRLNRRQDENGKNYFPKGTAALYRFWGEDYAQFVSSISNAFNAALNRLKIDRRLGLLSTDISNFYPTVVLDHLSDTVQRSASLSRVERDQVALFFQQLQKGMRTASLSGLPQGMVASGFFANIYLQGLDEQVIGKLIDVPAIKSRAPKVIFYSRYVDDIRLLIEFEPVRGRPAKKVGEHVTFKALTRLFQNQKLTLSEEKSTVLEQTSDGAQLTEGLLAEHMDRLAKKAYGSLSPESVLEMSDQLRLLFGIDSVSERRPAGGRVQRGYYIPVIDGPGVRPDSRRRFAAGRWRRLFATYQDCVQEVNDRKDQFLEEIFREWKADPSQIRLLYYTLELGDYQNNLIKNALDFLEIYVDKKANKDSRRWLPFIYAAILLACAERAKLGIRCPSSVLNLALESIKSNKPWFLRLIAWVCLAVYGIRGTDGTPDLLAQNERDASCRRAAELWQFLVDKRPDLQNFRKLFNLAKNFGISRNLQYGKLFQHFKTLQDSYELRQIIVENFSLLRDAEEIQITNLEALNFGRSLGLRVRSTQRRVLPRGEATLPLIRPAFEPLHEKIAQGWYQDEIKAVSLAKKIIDYFGTLDAPELKSLALNGGINPFSIGFKDEKIVKVNSLTLTGWRSIDWSKVTWIKPENISQEWVWPLGLMVRAALSAKGEHLFGATPSARYSLFLDYKRLNAQEEAFCSQKFGEVIMRLLCWPGSDILPYKTLAEVLTDLAAVETASSQARDGDIQLLSVRPLSKDIGDDVILFLCQVDHGLNVEDVEKNEAQARKAILYTLEEVEKKILLQRDLNIQFTTQEDQFTLVVLPEIFVCGPAAIGDLHRFVRKNKVSILCGRYFWKDKKGKIRNSLLWIFPTTDARYGLSTFTLRQDKIFPSQEELRTFNVTPANPKCIWRIDLGDQKRLSALICYELTNPAIKALLSGRVEAVIICAHNEDVDQFDGQAKIFSHDIHGFVALANTAKKGGTCVYAPYHGAEHAKQLVQLHGERQFIVCARQISISDFRGKESQAVKQPPAGFELKE